jgi:peroxiredoxin
MLEVGQEAPDFKLNGPGGAPVTLSEYRGDRNVVLVFYPLAFSPVCAHQLPTVQRELLRFEELDAVVFGVSVDSHFANEAFARRLGLTFPLLSDFKRQASTAYGVLNSEALHSGRAVFVIDKRGRVAYREVSANPGSMEDIPSNEGILRALEGLQ